MRTVVIYRSDSITGSWESRLAFQDPGVARGGLSETRWQIVCPSVPRLWPGGPYFLTHTGEVGRELTRKWSKW